VKTKPQWWESFFEDFHPVFGILPRKATNAQVRYLIKKLNLKPRQKFLDCPCGVGRIALPLAKKGIRVTGVDVTASYLKELERVAARRSLKVRTLLSDMRRIEFREEFDAAANMWTSFGYFERESDNLLVLRRMFQALKPGGRFLLHIINRDWIMANFAPRDWYDLDGVRVLEERDFDFATSASVSTWRFQKDGKETRHEVRIRMYSYHELIGMFRKVGFEDIQGCGGTDDSPIDHTCRMMFIFGRKPQ
jgi:SAM-dependent methyltransferase